MGALHASLLLHFAFCFGAALLADYDDECRVSFSLSPQADVRALPRVECSGASNNPAALTCDAAALVAKLDASACSVAALCAGVGVLPSLARRKPALVARTALQCRVALLLAMAVALVAHFG